MGRHSTFTPEIAEKLVDGISRGITMAELCREEGMPAPRTVRDWMERDQQFAAAIARAREVGFDAIAEECIAIAEDGSNDWMKRHRQDGTDEDVLNVEHVQRSKLRIETRLKLLAKWDPKRYGELVKLGNADGSNIELSDRLAEARARAMRGD